MERKYSVPSNPESRTISGTTSEDLHAWSIYRQNLNSDFTDSALGSTDKSPLPYGNFQLRDTTVQSILAHPRYGPKSALGSNMYTYLKFGLPRVFPPNHDGSNRSGTPQSFIPCAGTRQQLRASMKAGSRIGREGSSGYDSSDNETSNQYKYNRKYRSDPDFRNQTPYSHHIQQGRMQQNEHNNHPHSQWNRNKSVSEANLLSATESYTSGIGRASNSHVHNVQSSSHQNRRNSIAEFSHYQKMVNNQRCISKPESHISVAPSRQGTSVMRGDYLNHRDDDVDHLFMYPHLQVLGLALHQGVRIGTRSKSVNKKRLLINDVTFEIRGGEVMAVMATSESEGTAILDLIAGKSKQAIGEILLNGQKVKARNLKSRVAYVQKDASMCSNMTVLQTLTFHYDLKRPTAKLDHLKIEAIDRINVLIEDLGLGQVRNTKISAMTVSECRRLNVACHLLLDTDIVVLDQPTKGMDIFDTFFLVEYLRQWANGGTGRIVILTLHPPTYEIFTMLSRILLLSAGRAMYSGTRRDMLPYFTLLDYPCPAFKNPSDYYLDLVTLDDLSAEAMLESSQRIEQLAELFREKQLPLSDPGPPSTLPMTIKNTNCISQAFVLFTKSIIYTQPATFLYWLALLILSVVTSLILGSIFWDVPSTDPHLSQNDRQGFHYTVMSICSWPILLALNLKETRRYRCTVEQDLMDGLYGRLTYVFTKITIKLLPSLFVWLVYLVPSYSMTGLYLQSSTNYSGFYVYIGLMLMYLTAIQLFLFAMLCLVPSSSISTIFAAIFATAFSFSMGYTIHVRDKTFYSKWLDYINPHVWIYPSLLQRELSHEAISSNAAIILCRNKQVQHQDIIVQLPCPPPNGTRILEHFGYLEGQIEFQNYGNPIVALSVFCIICFITACIAFAFNCCGQRKQESNHIGDSNKP